MIDKILVFGLLLTYFCLWLQNFALTRIIRHVEQKEQRCGTCKARFNCLAWPGVCYPCPHYIDQDGIEEERRRRAEEEEDAYWATVEVKDD